MPVSAEEITAVQASKLYYAEDGSISVGSSYSELESIWIKLAPTGANNLMSINSFYKNGKNADEPTKLWYMAGEEWMSPVRFSADSGGDFTTDLTGGSQTFWGGIPTAQTEAVTVKLDGEEISQGTKASGGVAEITVENKIKAGNDKAGGWALSETVVYTIYDNTVDVERTLRALKPGYVTEYNGLQATLDSYDISTTQFLEGRDPAYSENDYYEYNSGLKADYPYVYGLVISSAGTSDEQKGDKLTMTVDREQCLGKLWCLTDSTMPVITVDDDKLAAFHLVAPVSDAQSADYAPCRIGQNGHICFKAQYKLEYVPQGLAEEDITIELTDITSVSAILTTNMPINTAGAALKIDDEIYVDVTETIGENTYKLAFTEPLSNGHYTLSGKVNVKDYDTDVQINADFFLDEEFVYGLSNATEGSMLLTTNLPIDTDASVIKIGDERCTIEELAGEPNKYVIKPKTELVTALAAEQIYDVTIEKLVYADGTVAVEEPETEPVTVEKGVTEISVQEIVTTEDGTRTLILTGTNNVVGYCPVVVAAGYTSEGLLCSIDYKSMLLPYDGEFGEDTSSPHLWIDDSAASVKAFVFDNMQNLVPIK